jgi:outer membrane protein
MRAPGSLVCAALCAAIFTWGFCARAQAAPEAARKLTLSEAIRLAVEKGPDVAAARLGVTASEERVSGASSQRFPRLHAEGNIQYWDKALVLVLAPAPGTTTPGMPANAAAITVRDRLTWQTTVSLAQPLSGLFALGQLVALERNGLDAARADATKARLDTAQRTAEAYLRLLQAQALEQIAAKSLAQVEAQLARAKVLEQGGVLGAVDVLRLTSARDSAHQNLLRARSGVVIAGGGLALSLDLPPETPIDVTDNLPDPPPPITWQAPQVTQRALEQRPELKAAKERTEQAQAGRGVAKAALVPNINGMVSYQHTEGQGPFLPKNAYFVGATLSWDLWDWGKNWSGVKEAEARAGQAVIAARTLRDQVAFDAQRRLLEARTTFETVAVARSALQAAEEAHRIQTVRYQQGAATTTDVLDAESDLARARTGYSQARYDYYLAQAGLARAVGQLPSFTPGGQP